MWFYKTLPIWWDPEQRAQNMFNKTFLPIVLYEVIGKHLRGHVDRFLEYLLSHFAALTPHTPLKTKTVSIQPNTGGALSTWSTIYKLLALLLVQPEFGKRQSSAMMARLFYTTKAPGELTKILLMTALPLFQEMASGYYIQ